MCGIELKHVNIVRLHDVIHTESKLVLIFEVSLATTSFVLGLSLTGCTVLRAGSEEIHGHVWRPRSVGSDHCPQLYMAAFERGLIARKLYRSL